MSDFRCIALFLLVVGALSPVSHALARGDGPVPAAAIVTDSFGPRTTVFHRDAQAKAAAHPSYALIAKPVETPGKPGSVTPVFTTIEVEVDPIFKEPLPARDPAAAPASGIKVIRSVATIKIDPATSLYGTGEVAGPLLRNGKRITCWNTDAYGYDDSAKSLYQSHPWVLAVRPDGTSFGLLADTTYRCTIDTAATKRDEVTFTADGPAFPVLVLEADSPQDVLKELARLTGTMPLPPKWAIGYHQCRYSYFPDSRAREIAAEFRKRHIPCDVIWYDIDYMEAFRIFTFDRGWFYDPKALNSDLLKQGFHNVWMIDPGMKSREEPGPADRKQADLAKDSPAAQESRKGELQKYRDIRDSGTTADAYVKRADGKVYEGEVWPSWCFFPDYTSPKTQAWWSGLYPDFMANGITGVWNDMNEPAVFNVKSKTMPEDNKHAGDPAMLDWTGKPQGDRAAGNHARYHNVYGMNMVRATREGIAKANPDKRPFVLSRANYIGGHRYAATWTGDNSATWAHLEESVPMSLNVGLSGQPFIGPDIGGFAGNGDGKMFARWMGFGALLPFSRGHTGKDNINKEPWAFDAQVENTCREALKRRYRLLPYFYTLFHEASVSGLPIARPTFFADIKDAALRSEDDSFLLGSDVLVVAQMVPDGSRAPAMPRGHWHEFDNAKDLTNNLDLPRLYLRPGAIVPSGPDIEFADEKPLDPLTLTVALDENGKASGQLYEDAGDGYGYQKGEFLLSTYTAERKGGDILISITKTEGSMSRPARTVIVRVLTGASTLTGRGPDGTSIAVKIE